MPAMQARLTLTEPRLKLSVPRLQGSKIESSEISKPDLEPFKLHQFKAQRMIPSRTCPCKNSSHHRWYRFQSTFNECVSLIIPKCGNWCIMCGGNQKKLLTDSFFATVGAAKQRYCKMCLLLYLRSFFILMGFPRHLFPSPQDFRHICFHPRHPHPREALW